MIIRKAYKYRLNTNFETEQKMSQYAGNCRFLWNKALALNLYHLETNNLCSGIKNWTGLASFGKKK